MSRMTNRASTNKLPLAIFGSKHSRTWGHADSMRAHARSHTHGAQRDGSSGNHGRPCNVARHATGTMRPARTTDLRARCQHRAGRRSHKPTLGDSPSNLHQGRRTAAAGAKPGYRMRPHSAAALWATVGCGTTHEPKSKAVGPRPRRVRPKWPQGACQGRPRGERAGRDTRPVAAPRRSLPAHLWHHHEALDG